MSSILKRFSPVLAASLILSSFHAYGQEAQRVGSLKPNIQTKHTIKNSVQVKITPRGMNYFEKNLSSILGNIGLSLEEGFFPGMQYRSPRPLQVENLDLPADTKDLIVKVRSLLTSWFIGFPLKDIQPGIDIGDSGYTAVFNRFAMTADENLLRQLGKRDGAVLAIELEIKQLNVAVSRVRAFDMGAGSVFGQVGLDNVTTKIGGGATPIKIRLPFYIRVNDEQRIEFEALKISENLQQVDVELRYQKLIAPKVVLEVNGVRMEMNPKKLEQELGANMPQILKSLRGFLSDFAGQQLPSLLNQKAKEALAGSLEEINRLEPPGAAPDQQISPFFWGLQLEKITQNNGLGIGLRSFVEDPKNPQAQLNPQFGSRGPVRLNSFAPETYDLALSIDRAMINRILQLSFERKLFDTLRVGGPGVMKLTAIPTVDYTPIPAGETEGPGETFMKIFIRARVPPGTVTGMNSLGIRDNFELSFDLITKMRKIKGKPGVEIILHSIDENTLWINPNDIKFFGSMLGVKDGVLKELRKITDLWKTQVQKLPGTLPLPPEMMGIKLTIEHLLFDPNGHLVMYLNYLTPRSANAAQSN